MKNQLRSFIANGMSITMLLILAFSCTQPISDLDQIKSFHPEDKYFKPTMISLHFITETSGGEKLEATYKRLFAKYKLPSTAKGIPDGIYTGESPADAYQYKHIVEIEVRNEKIISVDYNEIKEKGLGKQEDKKYCEEMSISGTTPAIAYPSMEKQLIEEQDAFEVDAVSGATYSLYRMRYALAIALMKANIQAKK